MNAESNSVIQGTPSEKSTSYKRAHRANRKPVLVTEQASTDTTQVYDEVAQPEVPLVASEQSAVTGTPARKRGPKFFASVDTGEDESKGLVADPIVARLSRALRGYTNPSSKEASAKESKEIATPAKVRPGYASDRPRGASGFKSRYIFGMVGYLLIADVAGVFITNFMTTNHLEAPVFHSGPIEITRSTLVFLALLVIILVLFARFDLIPKSLSGALGGSSKSRRATVASKNTEATFDAKGSPPVMKQGVKGEHDDLYQEYRENQRYYQRRDRKR